MIQAVGEEAGVAPRIDRPIFIVGPHRSGTTLLYRILARHGDVGYFNRGDHRFPRSPVFARLVTRFGWVDEPLEAQRVWDHLWRGDDDVMRAEDALPEVARWYRDRVRRTLELRGATRFVAKYPRLSFRLEWLDQVFPGALFVHMVRDWRAVVDSTVERKVNRERRGGEWFGVRVPGWKEMVDLPHEIAAGRQFRLCTLALESEQRHFAGRIFQVRYDELCRRPVQVIRRLAEECELEWNSAFEDTIPTDLRSSNFKWQERLDAGAVERIRAEDREFFRRYEE